MRDEQGHANHPRRGEAVTLRGHPHRNYSETPAPWRGQQGFFGVPDELLPPPTIDAIEGGTLDRPL